MTKASQKFLLSLARRALEHFFNTGQILQVFESDLPSIELREERGTFVTLTKKGQLRGCIGHLELTQEVYLDVIDNALSAAFDDPRFDPLPEEDLSDIEIEISILSLPKEMVYSSTDDLLNNLVPLRDGVIISKGRFSATYLPQVWEDLPDKEEFLSSLCLKAGLDLEEWKKGELKVETYQAEVFNENYPNYSNCSNYSKKLPMSKLVI